MSDNIRKIFSEKLVGKGLELGPLHNPCPKHNRMTVDYVDRFTVSELRQQYPELVDVDLVELTVIDDAETLGSYVDAQQDFVIASHVIEHMRNPLGALENWMRVLRTGGLLYLVVPDYRKTFDMYRELTTLEHLILDYEHPDLSRDFEHFEDYAKNVNVKFFKRDLDWREEALRLLNTSYSIHFNCFDPESMNSLLDWYHENLTPLEILEGPISEGIEFHFLLRKL